VTVTVQTPPAAADPPRPANLVGAALLASWLLLGLILQRAPQAAGPLTFAFVMLGWVLSVMAHEFAHAAVAYLGGDTTVAQKGYLAFDPRRYGDVGVSLVLPLIVLALGGIGFPGGAVYLRSDLMRSRAWRSASALAGPAATLLVLIALASGLRIWASAGAEGPLFPALTLLAFLQATALILNLLPVPGLDGFNALRPYLPPQIAPKLRKAEGLAFIALFLVLFLVPGASSRLFGAATQLSEVFGLVPEAIGAGWRAFHFWS
jgi:Zn-dependent protease